MAFPVPSLASLVPALAERTVRATALAEQALASARLGAYRSVDRSRTLALAAAADAAFDAGVVVGSLQGVPTSIKDLYGVPGFRTHAGTPHPLPERFEEAGPVVQRLLDQLGVVTGKTHTVELAFGGIGTNPHAGTPINPWDATDHRVPGGSSAGAGVSLQEGSAVLAFGTDTAGSVRIPAAWTGTVGLKTTAGRWSTQGIVPLSSTLDTAGFLTRTVGDAAFAFAALDAWPEAIQTDVDLAEVRIGWGPAPFWENASPGVAEAVEAALTELASPQVDVAMPQIPEVLELFGAGGPVSAELDAFLEFEVPGLRDTLDPNVASRVASAGELSVREYLRRRHRLVALGQDVQSVFDEVDVIVTPTVANTPPRVEDLEDPDAYRIQNVLSLRNTCIVSYLGLCAISLPCGLDAAGMPVGLHLIAPPHEEERLLAVALAIESRLGTGRERLGVPPRLRSS